MEEYINRKKIHYTWWKKPDGTFTDGVTLQSVIDDMPTEDVIEVKHGYWKWKELYGEAGYMLVCSECEESEGACERYDYCPNCGAKMDGATDTNVGGKLKGSVSE